MQQGDAAVLGLLRVRHPNDVGANGGDIRGREPDRGRRQLAHERQQLAERIPHGRIIEIDQQGSIVWEFDGRGQGGLDRPSLAEELPNGNIIANDDLNHRVIVIDKASKRIVWQYGITGRQGAGPGELSIPDGVDIIAEDCIGWLAPMCQAGILPSLPSH
jgi:uncharacterized protein (UPF0248 family)